MQYNAIGEVAVAPTPGRAQRWMEALADYSPAVGRTGDGVSEVVITFESVADDLGLAAHFAAATMVQALGQMRSLSVMPTEEYDRRVDAVDVDERIGTTEAAAELGVSRQRIQQLAAAGVLLGDKVGRSLVFSRALIDAYARSHPLDR
jgi:excisionase family DNA binding protein